ncbi:small ubiquitin-related modifier 2-like [Tamandua tetradactyla]|uniref:small ubiquitin-related modifier 2-like n=1 Tax=Tamandua tetradactyla TaxID=48850 RepID=UPI0040538C6F
MADEKPREGVKTEKHDHIFFFFEKHDHINLKIAGQDGSVEQSKIKRHTPLGKLRKSIVSGRVEMEDEDTIDGFQQQTGGVY